MRAVAAALLLAAPILGPMMQDANEVRVETIPGTDVEFRLVLVPGGEFELGGEAPGAEEDELPGRVVRLDSFWMGANEVTHDEFDLFRYRGMDSEAAAEPEIEFDVDGISRPSPPYEDPAHGLEKAGHPATGMTRRSALAYAQWLSLKTGRLYRLPTEAEWEYACQAGGDVAYTFGDEPAPAAQHAWTAGNSGGTYHPVGTRQPNRWGIADLHGNVSEWVLDSYVADAYATMPDESAANPVAGTPPRGRGVVRGGGFDDALVRCADRLPELAAWKRRDPQIPKSSWWNTDSPHVGFRLVSPARELTLEEIRDYWKDLLGD